MNWWSQNFFIYCDVSDGVVSFLLIIIFYMFLDSCSASLWKCLDKYKAACGGKRIQRWCRSYDGYHLSFPCLIELILQPEHFENESRTSCRVAAADHHEWLRRSTKDVEWQHNSIGNKWQGGCFQGLELVHECSLLWLHCNSNLGIHVPRHGDLRAFTQIKGLSPTISNQCSWTPGDAPRTGSDASKDDQELAKCKFTSMSVWISLEMSSFPL